MVFVLGFSNNRVLPTHTGICSARAWKSRANVLQFYASFFSLSLAYSPGFLTPEINTLVLHEYIYAMKTHTAFIQFIYFILLLSNFSDMCVTTILFPIAIPLYAVLLSGICSPSIQFGRIFVRNTEKVFCLCLSLWLLERISISN